MNVYDSDRMLEAISKTHKPVSSPKDADAILINTCHIREKAAEKVYSEVGKYSDFKNKKKILKVIVAGCVAQAEGNAMLQKTTNNRLHYRPSNVSKFIKNFIR